jgi:hypothetical protein
MRTSLLPLLLFVSGCFQFRSTSIERGDAGQEIILVTRGHGTQIGYVADRATETCWFAYGANIAPLHCCDARKFKNITKFITWENDALCAARERARAADTDLEAATTPTKR